VDAVLNLKRLIPPVTPAIVAGLLLSAAGLAPSAARAQGGMLTPRVEYAVLGGRVAPGAERRLRAVVLWRGDSTSLARPVPPERRQAYDEARDRAARAQRGVFGTAWGGAATLAETNVERTEVVVLGQRFPLPGGDTTLVVMADRADGVGGPPVLHGAVRMLGTVATSFSGAIWRPGDPEPTAEQQRELGNRQHAMLLDLLRTAAPVAEFLR
jgi:hypothetical protein